MKRYDSVDKLPKLIRKILGDDFESLGFFCHVVNAEYAKGRTQAEAFDIAWKWLREVYNKP